MDEYPIDGISLVVKCIVSSIRRKDSVSSARTLPQSPINERRGNFSPRIYDSFTQKARSVVRRERPAFACATCKGAVPESERTDLVGRALVSG